MRVGFLNTSGKQNEKPFRIDPLGPLCLLTILEEEFGDRLSLSYTDLRGIDEDSMIYHIPELKVYLHYVTTPEIAEIQRIIAAVRRVYPKGLHLAGGPHVNIFPDESLNTFDAICIGEGEEIIKQMIRDIFNKKIKKIYRQTGTIDLNMYPFPDRKYLPKSAIVDVGMLSLKYYDLLGATVLFSRGCPFDCHFCSNQYKGAIRVRSPEWITKEIDYLKREYQVQSILLKDDQGIHTNRKVARSMLDAMGKANILWRGQSRANGIHPDTVRLAKETGCVEIAVGMESVSQRALDIMNKKIDLVKAKEYFKVLRQEGLDIKLLLILGLPGEPRNIAQQTIDFIEEVQPSNVSLSILCPIPGSEIWNNPQRFGMKINPNVPFDKYLFAFGRFDDDEKTPHFFEYDKVTPFGEGMSMDEIIENHETVQTYLRERHINF
ncbi:MAG: B12-binding domain-containing radical SAM protein [Deltaproteobacteria bacterium]|nr:B12-binding domain-containing radical SAM protein [Deltaproteobacteria bacterium]